MPSLLKQFAPAAQVPLTISSRDIAELTGKDHFHVMRDLRAMHGQLGDLFGGCIHPWIHPQNGQTYDEYLLDKDTSLTLLLGYDPVARMKVVKRWQELESQVAAPLALTPAEMFLQNAQAMVAVERRQLAQAQELARISESVDTLMVGSMTLTERPANSEAITHIRPRMLKKYQLPARIVDLVMRQMPYSPKPAGMVRNHREEAQGTSYAVYWVKDVNTTFSRFVRDCKRVTATKVTHPELVERGVVLGNETPYTHPQNADLRSVCISSTCPPIGHLRGWLQSESSRPARVGMGARQPWVHHGAPPGLQHHSPKLGDVVIQGVTFTRDVRGYVGR